MKEYKLCKHFGYGGISCPCCTPFNSVKKNRTWTNRVFRRQSKIGLKKNIEESIDGEE